MHYMGYSILKEAFFKIFIRILVKENYLLFLLNAMKTTYNLKHQVRKFYEN